MSEKLRRVLASNIRKRRLAMGLSQESLASVCNLHRTYIGGVERAERNITLEALSKIATALEISPDELLRMPVQD